MIVLWIARNPVKRLTMKKDAKIIRIGLNISGHTFRITVKAGGSRKYQVQRVIEPIRRFSASDSRDHQDQARHCRNNEKTQELYIMTCSVKALPMNNRILKQFLY